MLNLKIKDLSDFLKTHEVFLRKIQAMKDRKLKEGTKYLDSMSNQQRIKQMYDINEFEKNKKEIFDKTEILARLIDERNDFFQHADTVSDVRESAKIEQRKKAELFRKKIEVKVKEESDNIIETLQKALLEKR